MAQDYLTEAARRDIQYVVEYLSAGNGLERPGLNDTCYDILARHYVVLGASNQNQFKQDLYNRPIWTLLTAVRSFNVLGTTAAAQLTALLNELQVADNGLEKPFLTDAFWDRFLRIVGYPSDTVGLEQLRDRPIWSMLYGILNFVV